jgi:DNA replication and repair protein RecF
VRDFRNCERAELELGAALTVLCGPNGAGKTNLVEALYFGCTGRSCRTSNERELVRHGESVARVTVETEDTSGTHLLEVGFDPGEAKVVQVDGARVERLADADSRPLVAVFLPERLELVKGAPSVRRGHLDQLVAALWPARAATRPAYARALAQRNSLVARSTSAADAALDAWDSELARAGAQLMGDRAEAVRLLEPLFSRRCADLGLPEDATLEYRPRSRASDAEGLRLELRARREADLARGFTVHGPHRDDLALLHDGRSLRVFGSQGQQRTALLALLFAERDLLLEQRDRPPLMLLDDVTSELDSARRERLSELLAAGGQAVVTTTDLEHVPGSAAATVVAVAAGRVSAVAAGAVR